MDFFQLKKNYFLWNLLKLNVRYVYVYFMPSLTDTVLVCW